MYWRAVGLYTNLYPQVVERLRTVPVFHGSWCRDLFIEHAAGRWAVDNQAERLISELVEEGLVEIRERDPTHSQAAFAGLQYGRSGGKLYHKLAWGPGIIEHHRYAWLPKK